MELPLDIINYIVSFLPMHGSQKNTICKGIKAPCKALNSVKEATYISSKGCRLSLCMAGSEAHKMMKAFRRVYFEIPYDGRTYVISGDGSISNIVSWGKQFGIN